MRSSTERNNGEVDNHELVCQMNKSHDIPRSHQDVTGSPGQFLLTVVTVYSAALSTRPGSFDAAESGPRMSSKLDALKRTISRRIMIIFVGPVFFQRYSSKLKPLYITKYRTNQNTSG